MEGTERPKLCKSTTVQVCRDIKKKKRKKKKRARRRKTSKCLLCTADLKLRRGGLGAHFTGRGRTSQPEVVLLPRLGLFSRIGWSHVELHILDLPITQTTDQVINLSPGNLPMPCEDTPQCWVVNEGMPSGGPPLGGTH